MYSSRGGNAYGQQSYGAQSAYGQSLGPGYSGSSVGVPDGGAQVSLSARHSSMIGSSQEAEVGGYRGHSVAAPHYGGQYSSVYGSASLSGAQQVPAISVKGAGASALEGRVGYASAISDSPKFATSDYVSSSSHGYGVKSEQIYAEKIPDYSAIDRRQYGERQSAYMGRDLQSESTGRFADTVSFGHQHQPEMCDRIDQASLLRREQLLKAQSLQSTSLDGGSRQADYLAARGTASRHSTQDLMPYGARMDADPRNFSMLSASSYSGQHASSILGAAPRRNVDDLTYPQSSANPGYGVSLPPGRDYATGKGLHATSVEPDYPGSMFSRGGHPRIDEHKDDRASYLREFELREEERRREHLREKEREREREKERERQRERQRQRERERERERILERREKERERERERKHGIEIKRERTPPRVSRDRRGPSLTKERRSLQRESPRQEVQHRRHSPVKEKRREYVCKVNSSSFVDVERDYISIDKRYPRLFVPPEVSKVVVNWPKDDLKLSVHTPVSFEHDFIEEETVVDPKEPSIKLLTEEQPKSEHGSTVWNAKIILMSGLSRSALEELSSEKSSDDRIPHICNILRFALLKKDHSFMAIGGPWLSADGGNPSVDYSSLVQTAIRYAKDVAQLDLQNCRNWNRFIEIHYDRVGEDGLFSHKEITVFFVPDLSECLPSLDAWRAQWLAHKKAIAEREHQVSLRRERSREKKDGLKEKEMGSSKDVERVEKSGKKKESPSSEQAVDINKNDKGGTDMKGNAVNQKGNGTGKKVEKTDGSETGMEGKNVEKKEQGEATGAQTVGSAKPGKRKIIRRIVKPKVVGNGAGSEKSDSIQNKKLDEKDAIEQNNTKLDISGQQEESAAEPSGVKTFTRKKVAKKDPIETSAQDDDKGIQLEVKAEDMGCSDDKTKDNSDPSSTAAPQETVGKTTKKKKIIKRVLKRKVTGKSNDVVADPKIDGDGDQRKEVQTENETENTGGQAADAENEVSKIKKTEKQDSVANSSKNEVKDVKEDDKDVKVAAAEMEAKEKVSPKDSNNGKRAKSKEGEKPKDEKVKKDKDGKDDSRSNSNKEVKEKRKPEEPPRHPGLILQTKWKKDSKLRSLSLSLDSLLDYTDKDIEESSFELSLFAETLYEMLQYQMGCHLLAFLRRLRIKFLTKRNQRKRQRDEIRDKENDKKVLEKRPRTNELPVKNRESEPTNAVQPDEGKTVVKEDTSASHVDEAKLKVETEDDEDPEEDPEEYEEMEDGSSQNNSSDENDEEESKTDANAEPVKEAENGKDEADKSSKAQTKTEDVETKHKSDVDMSEEKEKKVETRKKKDDVDKELLQAFRFFDRNLVGYIRVEDMRLIIHNLGKFLSHRDVKELVQSALLESNTGRDDRILYNKLVKMSV